MNSGTNVGRSIKAPASGYTLIELMIIVGIIGILSSLAYGAFRGYTAEADRAQVQADLLEAAQAMEREFTATRDYTTIDEVDLGDTLDARNPRYDFTVTTAAGPPQTYQIVADATQSRDNFDLSINERGVEQFRPKTSSIWSATTGWAEIP